MSLSLSETAISKVVVIAIKQTGVLVKVTNLLHYKRIYILGNQNQLWNQENHGRNLKLTDTCHGRVKAQNIVTEGYKQTSPLTFEVKTGATE